MKKILDIYNQYHIMPQLVDHQLRVAAVAFLLCDALGEKVNKPHVVTACLLHDMGNIIKFDFEYTKNYLQDLIPTDELEYWKGIQKQYRGTYGPDEHHATLAIAKELGVTEEVLQLIDSIGFLTAFENAKSENYNRKVCAYADMRISPFGVVRLEERFADLRHRYHGERALTPPAEVLEFENALRNIEGQIFFENNITPEYITPGAVLPVIETLKTYSI